MVTSTTNLFSIDEDIINRSLDYLVHQFENNKIMIPNWTVGANYYINGLEISYTYWISKVSLDTLMILKDFKRLE